MPETFAGQFGVVLFYRGAWCPYCNAQLRAYQRASATLADAGIRVVALLPGATNTDIWTTLWPQAPRKKMMSPESVAEAALQAILQPANATVESLEILPTVGTL